MNSSPLNILDGGNLPLSSHPHPLYMIATTIFFYKLPQGIQLTVLCLAILFYGQGKEKASCRQCMHARRHIPCNQQCYMLTKF